MTGKSLRGIAAALLIGTATVGAATLASVPAAQAAGVRPEVGKPLQEAISLAKRGKSREALAKVHEAERVKNLTAEEKKIIAQTEQYIAVKTGNFSGGVTNATTAKAKFAADYNARRYKDVVGTDQDLLRKYGALDFQSQLIIGQAYYQMGDYKGALRYLDHLGNSDQVLTLKMAVAAKLGDNAAQAKVARELVLKGQSKFWTYLLAAADRTSGLSDEATLGVYRIRFLTGNMRNAEDYSIATQLAIQLGYPQEAVKIEQKGFDAKVLSGARQERLLALAKDHAAAQQKEMPTLVKQAKAAKTGTPEIKLAEVYWGIGQYKDALDAAQDGIKKGVKNTDHAQIVLGMAYTGLKKTRDATRAFAKVKAPGEKVLADLWSTYARTKH